LDVTLDNGFNSHESLSKIWLEKHELILEEKTVSSEMYYDNLSDVRYMELWLAAEKNPIDNDWKRLYFQNMVYMIK
jgi:hypothetical protein